MDENTLLDIQLKTSWLNSLAVASSTILAGNGLADKNRCEEVSLYLLDIMAFISAELEGDIAEKLEKLILGIEEKGADHE